MSVLLLHLQVLLARGVQQDKILFLSMVAAPEAIHKLCGTYPAMKVLTSEIDRGLDENCRIVPGIGEFGERYFSD
jgi:uridine kinase